MNKSAEEILFDPIPDEHVVSIETQHGPIQFLADTGILRWRAETLLTKEPETIVWLDQFDHGDVFWDIGANVGVYSLYAAKAAKVSRILAFEPSPWNFAALVRSVQLNGFSDRVWPYCVALSDTTRLDCLYMQHAFFGSAQNSFGEAVDEQLQALNVAHTQAALGFSIDEFIRIFDAPLPNRIKIDVDGLDALVVKGMMGTLQRDCVKSVIMEINGSRQGELDRISLMLKTAGLEQDAQLAENSSGSFSFSRR